MRAYARIPLVAEWMTNSFWLEGQSSKFDFEGIELLSSGHRVAAAVVSGVVLETTIRQLCMDTGVSVGKLDKINADLAKAGVYDLLVQKRITALADIRNNAAHRHPEQFKTSDVYEMISYVENFVSERLRNGALARTWTVYRIIPRHVKTNGPACCSAHPKGARAQHH